MKNIAIIYHRADFDGKLSNEVCRFHLQRLHPNAAIHSYGWDYGMPLPDDEARTHRITVEGGSANTTYRWEDYDVIYIVDLSVDELMGRGDLRDRIVWIDHHKSAIEKWDQNLPDDYEKPIRGFRIDGVAACRLCWQWFTWGQLPKGALPSKQDVVEPLTKELFVDRKVREPRLLRLAGEYDIWDHRDPDAKALQFGLRSVGELAYQTLITGQFNGMDAGDAALREVIATGHSIKAYCDRQNDEYSRDHSHTIQFGGLTMCALNIGQRGNSDLLRGGLKLEHQACFAWRHVGTGDKPVMVSLYHVPGHTDLDLSLIAVKYGGGGHKGACGFRVTIGELEKILSNVPPVVAGT